MKKHMALLASALLVPAFALMAGSAPAQSPAAQSQAQAVDALAANLALPFASDLAGAADAPVFAWIEVRAGRRNIWVAAPDAPARQRTAYGEDDGIELSDLVLSRDGKGMLFVRGGDVEFPESNLPNTGAAVEPPAQALFIADVGGSQAPVRIGLGHGGAFSPDGARVAFTRKGEISVWNGGDVKAIASVAGSVEDLSWSPDGKALLFREVRKERSFVGLIDIAGGTLRYLGATLGHSSDPVFSPDGSQVAFIQFRDPPAKLAHSTASFWSVRVADVATGAVSVVWTAPSGEGGQYSGTRPRDLTPDANEVETFTPTPDGQAIVYAANAGNLDSRQLWRSAIAGGRPTRLTQDDRFVFRPVFGGGRLAATATDAARPAHMVLVDGMKPLGAVPFVRDYAKPETVVFKAADGVDVHAQLFRGKGKGKGRRPALVFVHGGPRRQMLPGFHPSRYYSNSYVRNQAFAAQGYTVLSVNYRSGTNYGRAFREAPDTAREGAAEYRDILAGGQWLARQADVDHKRIGIWGGSWGGYLTALALARNSDLFKAGVDLHGVHAMVRPVEKGYSPEEEAKAHQRQWDSSPMGAIETWRSPVLIIHGDDDKNVDHEQSLLLARELAARGIPFEELSFPNERHDFFRYENWLASYRAAERFFARTLGDPAK